MDDYVKSQLLTPGLTDWTGHSTTEPSGLPRVYQRKGGFFCLLASHVHAFLCFSILFDTLTRERGQLQTFSIRTIETRAAMIALCDVIGFSPFLLYGLRTSHPVPPPHKGKKLIFIERSRGRVGLYL